MTDVASITIPNLQRGVENLYLQEVNRSSNKNEYGGWNKEHIEETNRDSVIMAAETFLKKHIVDGDLAKTVLEALKMAHHRYLIALSTSDDESSTSKYFQDLVTQLSGMFKEVSDENNKHKPDLLKIVNEGIEYAFTDAPKKLSFLDGAVLPFLLKLPFPDILKINVKVHVRADYRKMKEDRCGWRPYHTFVIAVGDLYREVEGIPGSDVEEDSEMEEDSDPDMMSDNGDDPVIFEWCGDCVDDEVCKSCGNKNGCPPDYNGPPPSEECPCCDAIEETDHWSGCPFHPINNFIDVMSGSVPDMMKNYQ